MRLLYKLFGCAADGVFAVLCAVTITDYPLMKQCPNREKVTVVHTFSMLTLQLAFIFTLMTATLHIFLPLATAMVLSALISSMVVLMEVRMIASIWTPQGILSEGFKPKEIGLLMIRLVIAFIMATAYAVGVELVFFDNAIDERVDQNNQTKNSPLVAFYSQQQAEKRSIKVKIESDIRQSKLALEKYRKSADHTHRKLQRLNLQTIELERLLTVEEKGLEGRPAGKFHKYKTYKNDLEAKLKEIDLIKVEQQQLEVRYSPQQDRMSGLLKTQKQLEQEIIQFDPRQLAAEHPDFKNATPLGLAARYRILAELKQDPEQGPAVIQFAWIIKIVIMTLELLPLIVKVFFTQGSIYTEMIAAETRCETAAIRYSTKKAIEAAYNDYINAQQQDKRTTAGSVSYLG